MLVCDVMSRDVITIAMDRSLQDVEQVFEAAEFHHLIVTEHHKVVGVLSDRDLLKHISPFVGKLAERSQDLASLNKRVHQIMTRQPKTVGPDVTVSCAGEIMLRDRVSCLPVVDSRGKLLGIITLRDIARAAIETLRINDLAA